MPLNLQNCDLNKSLYFIKLTCLRYFIIATENKPIEHISKVCKCVQDILLCLQVNLWAGSYILFWKIKWFQAHVIISHKNKMLMTQKLGKYCSLPCAIYMVEKMSSVLFVQTLCLFLYVALAFYFCSRQHLSGAKSQPVPAIPEQRRLCWVPSVAHKLILKTPTQSVLWGLAWGCMSLTINLSRKNKIELGVVKSSDLC